MSTPDPLSRAASVYCRGPLLEAVQAARVYEDCKTFVDMPMKADPEDVLAAFALLDDSQRSDKDELTRFMERYFEPAGSDVVELSPPDFPPSLPGSVAQLISPRYRAWADSLHAMWPQLIRAANKDVDEHPQRHSLLPRSHPVVVPGGRFRESYYWDTFWTLKGLLASGMAHTATMVVGNLLDDVARYGFVPNGGRVYFLRRSQPPLLSDMVVLVFQHTADEPFLRKALPLLEKEHAFWMAQDGTRCVTFAEGRRLNRYWSDADEPRPESWREDTGSAKHVLPHLVAAAESGWDFSSRWMGLRDEGPTQQGGRLSPPSILNRLQTNAIIPVCLNTFLLRTELNIARLHAALGGHVGEAQSNNDSSSSSSSSGSSSSSSSSSNSGKVGEIWGEIDCSQHPAAAAATLLWRSKAQARADAMDALMWDSEAALWRDLVMQDGTQQEERGQNGGEEEHAVVLTPQQSGHVTAACFLPLWAGLRCPGRGGAAGPVVAALEGSGLVQAGGVLTSLWEGGGQQWDHPNAWPPLQSMIVEGLEATECQEGRALARQLALRWLQSGHTAWLQGGAMHEKYDATVVGQRGAGGEYTPQVGFGWSNGTALAFMMAYGSSSRSSSSSADEK